MFKSANPYDHKRLTDENIQNYILSTHLNYDDVSLKSVNKLAFYQLSQKDFEQKQKNSIILNIASCIYYYCSQVFDKEIIYNSIESLMYKYFYDLNKEKFLFLFTGLFYERIMKYFQLPKKIKSNFIKHLGFNFYTIKDQVDNKKPVIIHLLSDGRGFYKHDTLTIIGYAQFILSNNLLYPIGKQQKLKNVLLVYDHFSNEISYLDYDSISTFSCIFY